jgi:hypothetical protein
MVVVGSELGMRMVAVDLDRAIAEALEIIPPPGGWSAARWHPNRGSAYREAALAIVRSLAEGYAAHPDSRSNALLHGVQNKPAGQGVDQGNLWGGDYFYLEALARLSRPSWAPAEW